MPRSEVSRFQIAISGLQNTPTHPKFGRRRHFWRLIKKVFIFSKISNNIGIRSESSHSWSRKIMVNPFLTILDGFPRFCPPSCLTQNQYESYYMTQSSEKPTFDALKGLDKNLTVFCIFLNVFVFIWIIKLSHY